MVNIIESQDAEIKKFTEIITELKNTINETKKNNDELNQDNKLLQNKIEVNLIDYHFYHVARESYISD